MSAAFLRESGRDLRATEIAAHAARGDDGAILAFDRYLSRLARGLAVVIDILDPDIIVLGGGLSNIPQLYDALPPLLTKWCFSDRIDTPVLQAMHGDSSGVRGAAWLWQDGTGQAAQAKID